MNYCRLHKAAAVFWAVMAIPSVLYWRNSVPYLVFISVYALVTGHWAAYQGARAEQSGGDDACSQEAG